jgi:hypothetical protein
MDYSVFVNADGASDEQVELARATYRSILNQKLGGEHQAKPCFTAFAKSYDGHPLSPQEDARSGAWMRAEHAARTQATNLLPTSPHPVFTFRLDR